MSDIFENTVNKYRHSASAVMLFIASFIMFAIGMNHFMEDTWSSFLGLKAIETAFNLKVQVFDWTYWTMSIAPQVASIVFFFIFLSNTQRYEYLAMAIAAQGADFFSDAWYRSNGNLLNDPESAIASALITFTFFTIGSEVFLTIGTGLMLKMAGPALATWKRAAGEILRAKAGLPPVRQEKERDHQDNSSQKHHNSGNQEKQRKSQFKPDWSKLNQQKPEQKAEGRPEPTYHPVGMSASEKSQKPMFFEGD